MPSIRREGSFAPRWIYNYVLTAYLLLCQVVAAGKSEPATARLGYSYGQPIPVTCLNRTIDSGEHITDNLGKLQYIPFPTCNETFQPLAFRYGVTETVNCTINSLSDIQYHLFEYYVHSDAPLTCRVPTAPLSPSSLKTKKEEAGEDTDGNEIAVLDNDGPSYTPITFALQGTLQRSHLHIWTDMNVLLHNIASVKKARGGSKKKSKRAPGYVVAGTAYSVPEFDVDLFGKAGKKGGSGVDQEQEATAVAEAAQDPWTAGHGTKVVRGEPLTFSFHVSWVEGGHKIGWPGRSSSPADASSGAGAFFSKLMFFVTAAAVGAVVALYLERNGGRNRGWRGDGILGAPFPRGKTSNGISFGNGGRANGYGGYSAASGASAAAGTGGYGYGGYSSGKKD